MINLKEIIRSILNYFFPPAHVTVPQVLSGSPDFKPGYANNTKQDWFPYFSLPYNSQEEDLGNKGNLFEDNCTVQGSIAIIEAILNFYIKNNDSPAVKFIKNYYCNEQGYVKLSVRYNSKLADIQKGIGANLATVWDLYAIHGVIPQKAYTDPTGQFTWEEYMQDLPAGLEAYGAYSLTLFKIIWTALNTNGWNVANPDLIRTALKSSPLCFASQIGNIDSNGIEQPTGYHIYQHVRVIGSYDDYYKILDNYPSKGLMTRKLSPNFPLPCLIMAQVQVL